MIWYADDDNCTSPYNLFPMTRFWTIALFVALMGIQTFSIMSHVLPVHPENLQSSDATFVHQHVDSGSNFNESGHGDIDLDNDVYRRFRSLAEGNHRFQNLLQTFTELNSLDVIYYNDRQKN